VRTTGNYRTDLEQRTAPDTDDERRSATALRQVHDEWNASGDLPTAEQKSLRMRYDAGTARIEACIADISRLAAAQEGYAELMRHAQALLEAAVRRRNPTS